MKMATLGLDIAKQTFQVQGMDRSGKVVVRRRLRRTEVAIFFARVEPPFAVFEWWESLRRTRNPFCNPFVCLSVSKVAFECHP